MQRATRWSDNDFNFGIFTWAYSKNYPHWAAVLKADVHEDSACGTSSLRFSAGPYTLIITLPQIIKPHMRRVVPGWDKATIERLGRDYYDLATERAYGFSYSDGFLQVFKGLRTDDSSTDRSWSKHLPWTQWRHARRSLYGLKGEEFFTEHEWQSSLRAARGERYEIFRQWEALCPVVQFKIRDFDGAEIIATSRIEERAWLFGTGWFKWLSLFRRPKIRRTLHIEFSDETGPEKGSWKGGTMGTGIDMLPGELHEEAFRRYCNEAHRSKYRNYMVEFVERLPAKDAINVS